MKKLIEFWSNDDDECLKIQLQNGGSSYDYPSHSEVIEYLKETDADGDIEEVMEDLIIQFIDNEFWLDNC